MPNIRPINQEKYGISKHKFLQAYHFCMQYNEWKDELMYKKDTVKGQQITDMPRGGGVGDATQKLAIRRMELNGKCKIVEQSAIKANPEIYQYIIKAAANEGVTYKYLKECMGIPCGKDLYYNSRRKFYYELSKKM